MISYVKGTLAVVHPTFVVVDVQGIGYHLFIPCRLMSELPPIGQTIQLHTTFVVREVSQALYGFLSSHERDVFEVLMNVSGIGPKLALSLIGHLTFQEMQEAVAEKDLSTLCKVPGVGKKTAERLIVELKDKFSGMLLSTHPSHFMVSWPDQKNQHIQDAMLALVNLGYNQNIAQKAIKQSLNDLPEDSDLALLITAALKYI